MGATIPSPSAEYEGFRRAIGWFWRFVRLFFGQAGLLVRPYPLARDWNHLENAIFAQDRLDGWGLDVHPGPYWHGSGPSVPNPFVVRARPLLG